MMRKIILVIPLLIACKSKTVEYRSSSDIPDFVIANQVLFRSKIQGTVFAEKQLHDIKCDMISSPGTLFGKPEMPVFTTGAVINNSITLRFSEKQFHSQNAPKEYAENPALKANVQVMPPEVKVTRFSHFCDGYTSGFLDKISQRNVLIVFSNGPFSMRGELTLGQGQKIRLEVDVSGKGFHVLRFDKKDNIETLRYAARHDVALILVGEKI